MRPSRSTSRFLIAAGAALLLAFLAGAFTAPEPSSPRDPKKIADGPPGPCAPGTLPDSGVCIPVANATNQGLLEASATDR